MEYKQFIMKVKDKVEENAGGNYDVNINHVIKNNSLELDGIIISNKESRISPNIYLNDYYEKYKYGESVENIANEILRVYEDRSEENEFDINFIFEEMKSKIIFRIVNYSKNKILLQESPHIRFLDLAITFHGLVKNDYNGIGTIRITNEHMNEWETDVGELMSLAGRNTQRIFPASIKPMNEVIESIMERDIEKYIGGINLSEWNEFTGEDIDSISDDVMMNFLQEIEEKQQIPMYILSNSNGINGASAILYTDILKEFSTSQNSDFYILPSSIHEVILVPYSVQLSKETLREMVLNVNQTQVPEDEVLSNQVYIYRRSTNSIEI
ncbi:DUF5688 family protein [Mobilisporobacter senegalensis]|nr:DUF5688 family protein [Mobilisporobacter senegalensis]